MAWPKALLLAILLDPIVSIRDLDEFRELQLFKGHLEPAMKEEPDKEDEVEKEEKEEEEGAEREEESDEDEEGPEESSQTSKAQPRPGKKHGEARWMYKKATDGFNELDKVVESIDAAADDASAKAQRVNSDYSTYRGRMHAAGKMLDRLSLSGQQFQKEVVDYFADAETDGFSPLALRSPDRDFVPDAEAVEKLQVAEVKEYPCGSPAKFCCSNGMVWSEVFQRTSSGCQAMKGSCEGQVHPAVSRFPAKEQGGQCVPKDAARYFRKSSDWEDVSKIETSKLLSQLAVLPEAENILAEKLTAAGTPKQVLVQSVCRNKHWVKLLSALKAGLCKGEHEEGEEKAEKEEESEKEEDEEDEGSEDEEKL